MRKLLLLTALVCSTLVVGWAQGITTSSISGQITTESGETLPGANVIAVHEPSGTEYGATTNENGRFTLPNMRVGGPYKVTISFVGNETQTIGGIYLKLGEPFNLDAKMKSGGVELSEVVISDIQDKLMNSEITGSVTNVSNRQIQALPTITRSLNDFARLTPQATSTSQGSIGGGNYRQNYITVDGSDFNNTFGIGGNLPANGSPISLDAIEEISVSLTPYDIRQANFIGSSMNAVTRSGTNTFSGSVYTFWRNEKQQGDQVGNNDPFTRQPLQINTYGMRVGGPIIKNKVFFFANVETGKEIRPGQLQRAATTDAPFGSSPEISRPLASDLDMISTYLRENYGYETGPYENYDNESDNTRIMARVDWNINKNHRLNIRYSQVESKSPSFMSSSTSGSGINYGTGAGRTNNNALWFKNTNYYQEANFYSLAAEVNSIFGGKFANTFRASYTNQNDPRSTDGASFPFVDILDGVGAQGVPYTSFGYEPFSWGNLRDVKSFSIVDYVTFAMGKHNITAGIQFDKQNTRNGFQRFGRGYYVFNSWNDFVNGNNPINYAITYSLSPGYAQAFPEVAYAQYSVYAQDEFSVNNRLKITGGLRLDLPTFPSVPEIKTHPLVAALTFEDGKKFDTGVMPDTRVMVSPRIGFNYDVTGDRSIQLRGGTGIFTGRVPTVWIVAQSGDAGLLQFTQTFSGAANTPGPFNPDPEFYLPATPPTPGTAIPSSVSAIDPDFKFPQTWKSSLAVDASLPFGIVATLEGIYNKDLNIAVGKNVNLVDPTNLNVTDAGGVYYPDNRLIYPANNRDKFINPLTSATYNATTNPNPSTAVPNGDTRGSQAFNPIMLSNGNEGYYWSIMAKLDKQFSNGIFASVAYVRSQQKVLYDGIGDQLLNTWSLTPISQTANDPDLSYSGFVVPDRVIASLSYRKEYLKYFATMVSLVFEGSIQGRYSYTYSSDFNRDGQVNDLIYIPRDASEIDFVDFNYGTSAAPKVYTAAQQEEIFFRYIENDKYLSSRKGQYAERNGAKMPWRNQVDLRLAQDIFVNIGPNKNTLQFTFDIFNFGNWLNPAWGTFDVVNAQSILVPTNAAALVPGGTVRPTFRLQADRGQPVTTTYRDNNSITSTYYMQFGLRYIFN
jgi:hypothetical protein